MSLKGAVTARCPAGCEEFEAEVWSLVHGGSDPALKERLLAGEINLLSCPHCSKVFYYEHALLYLDPARELLAFIYPEAYEAEAARWRARMEEDFRKFQEELPAGGRRRYGPSLFFGLNAFSAALRAEEEAWEEWEVGAAVARELSLGVYPVSPAWARGRAFPNLLPVSGSGTLRERVTAGLRRLVAANDRLGRYAAVLAELEQGGGWEEPPEWEARGPGPGSGGQAVHGA